MTNTTPTRSSTNDSPTTDDKKKRLGKDAFIATEHGGMPPSTRTLTLFDGISTIVGLMVGSGIFSTAGASQLAVGSPGLALIMMGVSGLLGLTGALCYAELGTMIPGSGGEAQYLARGFSPLMVFLFNWASILILKPGTVAILSVATATYLLSMIFTLAGVEGKVALGESIYGWVVKGVAIGCCLVVTLASSLSTKWSNRIQGILTLGKIGALALIIISGIYYALFYDSSIIKANLGAPFEGSKWTIVGFARALDNGLWAFEGWNNLNIVAGDLANPSVNLPLSIWSSMVAVVILYTLTLFGYYAVLPKLVIGPSDTVGIDFGLKVFGWAGNVLMPLLIASSTFGSALSSMVTSSEIIVLAAHTRQMPPYFRKISPSLGTAARAYWMQGLLAAFLVTLTGFEKLIVVYTFPTWIFYAACVIVLLKLRWTDPELARPYRVFITTPILFLISCSVLLVATAVAEYVAIGISFAVILAGIPLYYVLRRFFGLGHPDEGAASIDETGSRVNTVASPEMGETMPRQDQEPMLTKAVQDQPQ